MLSLCTWNVRGLNAPSKVKEVKRLLSTHNFKIIVLLETRVKSNKLQVVVKQFGKFWSY